MAKINWRMARLRKRPSRSLTEEVERLNNDCAARWLRKAKQKFPKPIQDETKCRDALQQ